MNTDEIFDFLYRNQYNFMLMYCISRKIKREDAEEIVDEAFSRFLEKFPKSNDTSIDIMKIWVYRAVQNIIKEKFRDSQKNMTLNIDDLYDICSDSNEISNSIENEGYKYYLDEVRSYVGEEDWIIYEAKFVDMLDYKEISEKLDIKQSTLRSRISRMKKKLKPFIMDLISKHLFFL